MAANQLGSEPSAVRPRFQLSWRVAVRQPVRVIDPAIESHYGSGYERSRLFPGGTPSLEFVRSMDLLERLLPAPPARVLDVGGGPGAYAAPLAQRGYRVHVVDPVPLPLLAEARRVLAVGGRLLGMAVCRFASLLDGLSSAST